MPLPSCDVRSLSAATCLCAALVAACNTVSHNAIGQSGEAAEADGQNGDEDGSEIEALCDQSFECGFFDADFDPADCVQMGEDCRVAVESANEGAFAPAVAECLEAPSCEANADCMSGLLDACLEASAPGGGGKTDGADDDTNGGDPAACELGVNALCTCYECTTAEAQEIYDACVQEGDEVVVCFAAQVEGDQIDCAAADEVCLGGGA